jgi:hypothetical protein
VKGAAAGSIGELALTLRNILQQNVVEVTLSTNRIKLHLSWSSF